MKENLLKLILHRPPFLFVDRVISSSEKSIVTEKMVKSDEPFFQGHFPGNPIMPGVLVCEAVFQSGTILVSKILKASGETSKGPDGVPVLTRIKDVKFKNIVRPNDLLKIHVELVEKIGGAYFMKGTAKIGGKIAASMEFAATTLKETASNTQLMKRQ